MSRISSEGVTSRGGFSISSGGGVTGRAEADPAFRQAGGLTQAEADPASHRGGGGNWQNRWQRNCVRVINLESQVDLNYP